MHAFLEHCRNEQPIYKYSTYVGVVTQLISLETSDFRKSQYFHHLQLEVLKEHRDNPFVIRVTLLEHNILVTNVLTSQTKRNFKTIIFPGRGKAVNNFLIFLCARL